MKTDLFKRLFFFFFFAVITSSALFLSKSPVFAFDIVINEILANPSSTKDETEYIELYNKTESDIDLTGWKLDDVENGGSKVSSISGLTIPKKGFLVFYKSQTSIALNNDGDDVRLLDLNSNEIDKIHYDKTKTDIAIGRIPDGTDNIVELSLLSPGESNGEPTPTPSPSPTIAPAPTKSPPPTKTPTPKVTPTPKLTATLKPTATTKFSLASSSKSPTPSKVLAVTVKKEIEQSKEVLGQKNTEINFLTRNPTASETPKIKTEVLGTSQNNILSKILIGLGSISIIACGILAIRAYKKRYEE